MKNPHAVACRAYLWTLVGGISLALTASCVKSVTRHAVAWPPSRNRAPLPLPTLGGTAVEDAPAR